MCHTDVKFTGRSVNGYRLVAFCDDGNERSTCHAALCCVPCGSVAVSVAEVTSFIFSLHSSTVCVYHRNMLREVMYAVYTSTGCFES
jgi:hypothetical protein